MKYFVFSDIHGCYKELIDTLVKSGYDSNNSNHKFISQSDNMIPNFNIMNVLLQPKQNNLSNRVKILLKIIHQSLNYAS